MIRYHFRNDTVHRVYTQISVASDGDGDADDDVVDNNGNDPVNAEKEEEKYTTALLASCLWPSLFYSMLNKKKIVPFISGWIIWTFNVL